MSDVEATPKPPQEPQRSLNRQYVLDEDEYTAALSQIIARDFFPSLVHLDATNDYLDATYMIHPWPHPRGEGNDTMDDTPLRTPWTSGPSDTPLRTPRGNGSNEYPHKKPKFDTNLSLDAFQARYTFWNAENQQRKERYGWAWDAQKRVEAQRDRMVEGREKMLIEPAPQTGVRQKFRIEAPIPRGLLMDGSAEEKEEEDTEESAKAKGKKRKVDEPEGDDEMALMVIEDNSEMDVMAARKDTRSAGVEGWKFKARNSLMFSPDADVSPYHQTTSQKEPEKHPKVIKYDNTRLPEQDQPSAASRSTSAPPSPTRSRIDAAIEGTPYRPKSPRDNAFNLVPTLPSPTPAELGPKAVQQLMTWGTLNATPRIVQSDDPVTAESPFRIAQMSKRETLSHRLSNKASKSLRVKAEMMGLKTPGIIGRTSGVPSGSTTKRNDMAPPTWTPRRADAPGNLTPAARRLLERSTLGTAAARRAEAMERNAAWESTSKGKERDVNQMRWTPTPSRR
ncbi:nuclear protein Es2-domain-containing protein [Ephemerocybe angulata]|uniref:Nuclear protein Es2-domain-containing protein n=1 Tax=Ephemerocybe angulata TaxID=980116 RepID=A0A8H6MHV4_9AGAR|nr:nuclear protein Es2-domain-containing protein [Tulosesus angulatus]